MKPSNTGRTVAWFADSFGDTPNVAWEVQVLIDDDNKIFVWEPSWILDRKLKTLRPNSSVTELTAFWQCYIPRGEPLWNASWIERTPWNCSRDCLLVSKSLHQQALTISWMMTFCLRPQMLVEIRKTTMVVLHRHNVGRSRGFEFWSCVIEFVSPLALLCIHTWVA